MSHAIAALPPDRLRPPRELPWVRGAGDLVHNAMQAIGAAARRLAGALQGEALPAGSMPSFEAAALPHLDAAYTFARYLCRDAGMAEDIVQDAYLRAFRGWSEFRGGSVRAWLFAIVRNCHLTHREQARRHVAGEAPAPAAAGDDADDPLARVAGEGDPESTLLRQDEDACVRRVLEALPDEARAVLVLRDIEDCSYREIADVLGLPIGTVMSRLSRARRAFAARWTIVTGESER
jgi:RNA polymerase sigma factor (sigma-70 family)